ncbi:DUF3054 domain-containing protein [Halonotius terrestris]|uniref:DUF3054 domain-containing protein n=1 Tax=Halonotius terrestris TaxID=2487750 RepID=A0A8J8TBN1_9EURY|nr:DUF3054 domain-containing protein [Halonotius terrestris]TQQ81127.1 DUF3054 domain-containing protein [Halonotius terrestris]
MLNERVDTAALPLAVGDLIAILGVLTIGMVQHGTLTPDRAPGVYAPFVIGWVVGALLIGAYSAGAAESAKAAIPLGLRAWVPAALVGFGLRATAVFPGDLAVIFVAITFVLTGALIAGLRWLFFKLIG